LSLKVENTTKQITDLGNIQGEITGKIGRFEGALKKAATSAVTGMAGNMVSGGMDGLKGFGGGLF